MEAAAVDELVVVLLELERGGGFGHSEREDSRARLGLPTLFVQEGGYAVAEIGVNAVGRTQRQAGGMQRHGIVAAHAFQNPSDDAVTHDLAQAARRGGAVDGRSPYF